MPKTIRALFVAELGAGYGNVAPLIGVAERLEKLGVTPVFAIADGVTPASLFEGRKWLRLPAPVHPAPLKSRVGASGYGDILALAGFADAAELEALTRQYDALSDLVKPAFIVGSHAPAATLAARGRLPVGLVGTGFTLPPWHTALFPALRPDTTSFRPEDMVLACVNTVLKRRGAPQLDTLPALLNVAARAVLTVDALDPYAAVRIDAYAALTPAPDAVAPEGNGVFAFLDMRGKEAVNAIDVLGRLAEVTPVAAHLRGPGARASAGYLARRGADVYERPADLDAVLPNAKVLLTQGGHGMALMALQRGRYNLVLPLHFESMLNGLAAERLGAGKVAWGGDVATIEAHLTAMLSAPIAPALVAAKKLQRPALFDAEAFLASLVAPKTQRRGKPSAAMPKRGQRSQGSFGTGAARSSYSSQPSMKPAA